jgi:hypothetical protein
MFFQALQHCWAYIKAWAVLLGQLATVCIAESLFLLARTVAVALAALELAQQYGQSSR